MGLFDSLMQDGETLVGGEAHQALSGALDGSSLGGMSGLLDKLHEGGLGSAVDAWCEGGDHPAIGADAIKAALGDEHVQQLASSLGVSTDELTAGLAQHLPALAAAHASGDDQPAPAADGAQDEAEAPPAADETDHEADDQAQPQAEDA